MSRFLKLSAAILALLAVAAQDPGQTKPQDPPATPEAAIVKEGLENSKVMEHLDQLCNKIGPRLTGSDNLTKAMEWAKGQFEAWGLKNATMEEWGTFPVGFNRGKTFGKMTSPVEKDLIFSTNAWSAGTKGEVEGPALLAKDALANLEAAKGAWVLGAAGGDADKLYGAGIAGVIRGSRDELAHTGGRHSISWDSLPTRVSVLLIKSHYDDINSRLEKGDKVTLKFLLTNEFKQGPIKLYNTFADIVGTEKPNEMVIVSGHCDSWDGAQGTTDNGTGASTTIEAARILAKAGVKPKRTIRFILWSGEEQGLLGSRGYVRKHKDEMDKIAAVFVHDGGTNYAAGISGTASQVPLFKKIFAEAGKLNPEMGFEVREVARLSGGSSDHDSFLAAGVPGYFWTQRGRAVYRYGWHTQNDRFELAIPEYQRHTATVIALGAWGVANLDELLPRDGLKPGGGGGGGGGPPRRVLGIQTADDGVTIDSVTEGSSAEKAGIKAGDVILQIGDKKVTDLDTLREGIRAASKKTTVKVKRGGEEKELQVEFEQ